ncbi:MarR family winged helix-turn-helix transcriptional regulator [Listeria seeligeri]|uniref:MarR family winged helix-turn-helix transcriptional regulator n=1 Tax=Listeria seeligeri TaxID=1640 RepID=UPI001628FCB3|nr:MarR family transcriptional regulator [Listeria seeligeri]MBC1471003.1 MarR family transcriptional regulator [Listeria seeligeri]
MRGYYDEVSFKVNTTAKKMHLFLMRAIASYDVTPEQWSVLEGIEANEPISQKEIALWTKKDTPTVNRIVDVLIRKELIVREISTEDRRISLLSLTEKGKIETNELREIVEVSCEKIFAGISRAEVEQLTAILENVSANLE